MSRRRHPFLDKISDFPEADQIKWNGRPKAEPKLHAKKQRGLLWERLRQRPKD